MRKRYFFAFILGIAAWAPTAIQISVDGNPDPVDSEILAIPSDTLSLGIQGTIPAGESSYWLMMVDWTMGTLSYEDDIYRVYYYYPPLFPDYSYVGGVTGIGPLSGRLVENIFFHAETAGDAVIELFSSPDSVTWSLQDQLVIHQGDVLPEPMTIILLAFGGGLISRHRKRER